MHRAGPALGNSAAIARAGQPDRVAQHPEQRGVGLHIHVIRSSVDGETGHSFLLTFLLTEGITVDRMQIRYVGFQVLQIKFWGRVEPSPGGTMKFQHSSRQKGSLLIESKFVMSGFRCSKLNFWRGGWA